MTDAWQRIEADAREAYAGAGRFPLRAYSELTPPPYVGRQAIRASRRARRYHRSDLGWRWGRRTAIAIETVADAACARDLYPAPGHSASQSRKSLDKSLL